MLSWVFGNKEKAKHRKKKRAGAKPSYEKAREIAERGSVEERSGQAAEEDLQPEILYYFATDESPRVRRAVANNDGTPLQADLILAKDADDEVRSELARKISRLVPSFTDAETDRLTAMAIEILEILAEDNLPRVRAIMAEELKRADNIPNHIVQRLARDIEEIVSAPILEYSPLLSEQDLLDIIGGGVEAGALIALARRHGLAEQVVDAVFGTRQVGAVTALLDNRSAMVTEKTLDMIAGEAASVEGWHQPLVSRDNLPARTLRRIAGFVSAALVDQLIERNSHLENDFLDELRQSVRKRIDAGDLTDGEDDWQPAEERAKKMHAAGALDEKALTAAIANGDNAFVRHALVLMSELPAEMVSKMLNAGSGKAVTALSWKAGLSMRTAMTLQSGIGRVQPKSMINARDGIDYPMPEEDLRWYIEFFSV